MRIIAAATGRPTEWIVRRGIRRDQLGVTLRQGNCTRRPSTGLLSTWAPEIDIDGETTRELVEQLGAVHVNRLGERIAMLPAKDVWSIDEALITVLGLT